MSSVSAVIVSWNNRELLARALTSLRGQVREILVVDNASEDGSGEMVRTSFPDVRLVAEPRNTGFAAGVNTGARAAAGEYVLLLNPDAAACPGAVDRLAAFLAAHPACAAAAGLLLDEQGQPQAGWNVRRFPTLATFAVSLLLVDRLWPQNPVTRRYVAADVDLGSPAEVEQPAAACLMLRRAAFDGIGGMDERFYPAWFEDVDLCLRLRRAGWSIAFVPDAVFSHRGGLARTQLGLGRFSVAWYRNLERYVRKHYRLPSRLAIKALIVAGMIERIVASAVAGRREAAGAYARVLAGTMSGWRWESSS